MNKLYAKTSVLKLHDVAICHVHIVCEATLKILI